MANPSTAFPIAIYRCTNPTDTESNLPNNESVGMNIGLPDNAAIGVIQFDWDIPARRTDVPAPQNQSTAVPDTGLSPPTITLGIKFNENVAEALNKSVGILTLWALQDKTVRTNFPNGRFGIRNDKKPWMNFQPTAAAGWKIVDVKAADVIQWNGMVDIIITMHFGGQTSLLAMAVQNIINSLP